MLDDTECDILVDISPEKLKAEYVDVYEGVYAEVISKDKFDEDTDLSTTYLGQVDMIRNIEVKAE